MKIVHFAIPIPARVSDKQWNRVNDLLKLTLGSIFNQTDTRYRVFVCGHDRPGVLSEKAFAAVEYIGVNFPTPEADKKTRLDKRRKRWTIARRVRELGGGYYMYMDADDLVHRDLVKFIVNDDNLTGYFLPTGYALDYANRRLAPIPGALRSKFSGVCGSSAAVYLLSEDLPDWAFDKTAVDSVLYCRIRNHNDFEDGEMRNARKLAPIPFPAGIYTLNNSINISYTRGRASIERQLAIVTNIKKFAITNTSSIRVDFALETFLDGSWSGGASLPGQQTPRWGGSLAHPGAVTGDK